jgi:RNA polymerase primary sigma factor
LPAHVNDQLSRVSRARAVLSQKLNRDPTLEEVAAETGLPVARVKEFVALVEDPVSLETKVGDGESAYGELLVDVAGRRAGRRHGGAAPQCRVGRGTRDAPTAHAARPHAPGLGDAAPETLERVGAKLGITRERVRQLEARAPRELRVAAPALELYLTA